MMRGFWRAMSNLLAAGGVLAALVMIIPALSEPADGRLTRLIQYFPAAMMFILVAALAGGALRLLVSIDERLEALQKMRAE